MHALPFLLAFACAAVLAPAVLRALCASGQTRINYRGRALPCPFGVLVLAAALAALVPLMLVQQLASTDVFHPEDMPVLVYVLGVLALGLVDDTVGHQATGGGEGRRIQPRGWRGHGAAALRGELSTGTLKAVGSLGLALLASKVFVVLGVALTAGSAQVRPLWTLGLFAAPALVAGVYDLRERAMLGDTGANLLGALAGLWLVFTLSATGQIVALALLVAMTLYGELRSISALIERTPGLRALDSWGRPS
jgi:hypothetical protein